MQRDRAATLSRVHLYREDFWPDGPSRLNALPMTISRSDDQDGQIRSEQERRSHGAMETGPSICRDLGGSPAIDHHRRVTW